jgi:hypothetical protein
VIAIRPRSRLYSRGVTTEDPELVFQRRLEEVEGASDTSSHPQSHPGKLFVLASVRCISLCARDVQQVVLPKTKSKQDEALRGRFHGMNKL